ncbi:hypothetical protein SAMN05892877_1275 [Rhizobium subbaraonis]|uniref:Uncharacterized protein n=1 Tax=Rhizobium subbaraonis TaxID=908946 RepID=A0A285UZ30_9HYPH|nr:hypothetical protein [Rhizobium subbaraonis]SOC47092.1 hypothetical protein SAMN05892877_1275 [Rhizobium subbaraonis]
MLHLRSRIFDFYRDRLAAIPGFEVAGKVKRGRSGPIPQEMLPALTLSWADGEERATIRAFAGPDGEDGYDRNLPLSIILHLRNDDPEEEFDELCVAIEAAMGAAVKAPGLNIETVLMSSRHYVNHQTGLSLCVGSLTYSVSYKTLASDPTTAAI